MKLFIRFSKKINISLIVFFIYRIRLLWNECNHSMDGPCLSGPFVSQVVGLPTQSTASPQRILFLQASRVLQSWLSVHFVLLRCQSSKRLVQLERTWPSSSCLGLRSRRQSFTLSAVTFSSDECFLQLSDRMLKNLLGSFPVAWERLPKLYGKLLTLAFNWWILFVVEVTEQLFGLVEAISFELIILTLHVAIWHLIYCLELIAVVFGTALSDCLDEFIHAICIVDLLFDLWTSCEGFMFLHR